MSKSGYILGASPVAQSPTHGSGIRSLDEVWIRWAEFVVLDVSFVG